MKALPNAQLAWLALLAAATVAQAPDARAAVPAEYTGTPYMGTAQVIPGRVELANLDEGGLNVAFFADHRRENAVGEGYSPVSGDDYRPGNLDLPNICKTNRAVEKPGEGSEDFWEDGKRYPSDAKLYEYYMGYAHTVDWVRVTVNVQQAGTYNVSSNWACANPNCGLSIWFNDGSGKADNPDRPLDGENKTGTVMLQGTNDYHKWRAYPNFAKVTLSAGPQVMTFNLEVADHLQYGFLQFDLEGGGGQGSGGQGGAAAGAGGASSGGTPGSVGVGGAQGGTGAMLPSGTAGALGSPAGGMTTAPAGTGGSPGLSNTAAQDMNTASSCALVRLSGTSRTSALLGLLLAASLLRRRARG